MNGGLGEHGVVLKLGLAQRRAVAGDEDQLGLARAESLHGGLGTHGNLARLHHKRKARGEGVTGLLSLDLLNVLGGWLVRSFVGWLATEEEKFAQVKIRSSVERALTTRD